MKLVFRFNLKVVESASFILHGLILTGLNVRNGASEEVSAKNPRPDAGVLSAWNFDIFWLQMETKHWPKKILFACNMKTFA